MSREKALFLMSYSIFLFSNSVHKFDSPKLAIGSKMLRFIEKWQIWWKIQNSTRKKKLTKIAYKK